MTQPHHYIFSSCEQAFVRNLKVEAVLPHLVEKKVVPESDISLFIGKPKNGMKILIGYLRNKSFETFLDFVECILLAQGDDPSKAQSVTVVDSMVKAMREYDQRNDTHWVDDVLTIQQKYMKTATEQQECVSEPPQEPGADTTDRLSMPEDLDYIEEPHQHSFRSEGGRCDYFEKYGFSLVVPPLAVPEGKEIKLSVGLCCYGPFSISEKYLLASDFAVIVADDEFSKPVEVFMDHCLILPEYKKCSEVLILKADHRKVTKDGLYTFDRFTIPDIDPKKSKLSFKTEEFCILCGVLESMKPDTIEYAALLFWPKKKIFEYCSDLYHFMILICTNCPVALKKWTEYAEEKLESPKFEQTLIPIAVCGSNPITMCISDVRAGWRVTPERTPTVSEREFRFCYMDELCKRIEQKMCPPRIIYFAECEDSTNRLFSCKVKLEGVTLMAKTDSEVFFNILASIECPSPTSGSANCGHPPYQALPPKHNVPTKANGSSNQEYILSSALRQQTSSESFSSSAECLQEYSLPLQETQLPTPPLRRSECQQDTQLCYLTPNSDSNSKSVCSANYLTNGSSELSQSQGSSINVHINVGSGNEANINVNIASYDSPAGKPQQSHDLSDYESRIGPEEKEKPLLGTVYLTKCVPHLKDWKHTARVGFGFTEAQVIQLESDHTRFSECAYQAYLQWRMQRGYSDTNPGTVWEMAKILHRAGEFEAISNLLEREKKNE